MNRKIMTVIAIWFLAGAQAVAPPLIKRIAPQVEERLEREDRVFNLIGDPVALALEKAAAHQVGLIFEPPGSEKIKGARIRFQNPEAGGAYVFKLSAVAVIRSITVQVEYPFSDVVSKKLGNAQGILKDQLLIPAIAQRLPLPADQIYVRGSEPPANDWVQPGQEIRLFPGVTLVDYRGRDVRQAQAELRELGFRTASITPSQTRNRPEGEVVAQDPPAGIVAFGVTVNLTMAVAPPTVIDLIGHSVPVAKEKVVQQRVNLIFDPPGSELNEGARIWFQYPEAGGAYVDDSITVRVEYPLANVVEMPLREAQGILTVQIVRPFVEQNLPLPAAQILVRSSTPRAGTLVRPGQTVRLDPGVKLNAYRGVQEGEAKADLRQRGFEIAPIERHQSRDHAAGLVIAQNPGPGIVAFATTVTLTIAVALTDPPVGDSPVNWWPYILGGGILLGTALLFWLETGSATIAAASASTGGEPKTPERPSRVSFKPQFDAGRQSVTWGPEIKGGKGLSIKIHGDNGTQRAMFPHDPASEDEI